MNRDETKRHVIALMAIVAMTHLWLIPVTLAPAPDTLEFVRIAKRLAGERFVDVVQSEQHHPLFPLLVGLVESTLRHATGFQGPECWRVAAQLVAAFNAVLLVVPLYLLSRELFSARIAWWGGLLVVLLPTSNRITADGLSDGLHVLWLAVGLWAAVVAFSRRQPAWFAVTGVAAGLGFWTRPEAIVLLVAVVTTLVGVQSIARHRWKWKPAICGVVLLLFSSAAVIGPYVGLKAGRLTDKRAARMAMNVTSADARTTTPNESDVQSASHASAPPAATPTRTSSCYALVANLLDCSDYVLSFLSLWALLVPWAPRSARPACFLVGVTAAAFATMLVRVHSVTGYLATRHTLALVVLAVPWAGSGLVLWLDRFVRVAAVLGRRFLALADQRWLRPTVHLAAASILAFVCLPMLLEPMHDSRWGHRQAAHWLAARCPPEAATSIVDHHGYAAFYTGLKRYDYQGLHAAAEDRHLRFVVVEPQDLERSGPKYTRARDFVARLGSPRATFPSFETGTDAGVLVFEYVATGPNAAPTPIAGVGSFEHTDPAPQVLR